MVRCLTLLILAPFTVSAQLKTAPVWMDHMVLQRNAPLTVSGSGRPGEMVQVRFSGNTAAARIGPDSTWSVRLPPMHTNAQQADMVITSRRERLVLHDLLVGDVWLCLGQSNMEFPLRNEAHYAAVQRNPLHHLRLYNPTYAGKGIYGQPFPDSLMRRLDAGEFYQGKWERCDSAAIARMSAVAFYFGETVNGETGVPIGLVHLAIGGAPLETFISREALLADSLFAQKAQGNWLENRALPEWSRERGRQNRGDGGTAHGYEPGFAFEHGLRSLTLLSFAGMLLYQGETNAQEMSRVEEYGRLFGAMMEAYRRFWPGMPCYFVQLSSIDSLQYRSQYWPAFRDGQRRILQAVSRTGMAVSSDVGARNDVHPTDKRTVGRRLAAWALYDYYRRPLVPSGPLPTKAEYRDGKVVVHFDWADALGTAGNKPLTGFSLDGVHPINAIIKDSTVEIETFAPPAFVYYGWQPYTDANLVNAAGLPASTFSIPVESSQEN
ncbi:sialate O-acetylesterase [Chitinophaga lutea]